MTTTSTSRGERPAERAAMPRRCRRVFVLGDSIAVQYGSHLERMLDGRIAYQTKGGEGDALRDLDVPRGQNAGDSAKVLAYLRWRAANAPLAADVLLVNCGLHDIRVEGDDDRRRVPLPAYCENLRAIVASARAHGVAPAWVRTTPFDEARHNARSVGFRRFAADAVAYDEAAAQIMAEAGVPVIDLHSLTLALGVDLYADHVHFRPEVRLAQAAHLAGWLMAWSMGRDDA